MNRTMNQGRRALGNALLLALAVILPGATPSPAAPFIYVANLSSNTVSVIDGASNT